MNRLYKCPHYIEWEEVAWNNGKFASGPDCDITAVTIHTLYNVAKSDDCGGLCLATIRCTHFTWESDGTCKLKASSIKKSSKYLPLEGASCGFVLEGNSDFEWNYANGNKELWSKGCDFPGNNLISFKLKKDTCFSLCISNQKCTSYFVATLSESVNRFHCFLKTCINLKTCLA